MEAVESGNQCRSAGADAARRLSLHCFHHAGGTPAAFRRWSGALDGAAVAAARTERGDGADQPSIGTLVAQWRAVTEVRAGVYYGHSMGALVAFEAAAAALAEGEPGHLPRAVVLGAPPAPGCEPRVVGGRAGACDARLLRGLERVRRYRPSRARLPIPVHVLWGALDDVVPERDARTWVARGSAGSSWHRIERAGHLFHLAPGREVLDIVRGVLARSIAATWPRAS